MHRILGAHAAMPWGRPSIFNGFPQQLGLVGTDFDYPDGGFPVPWGQGEDVPLQRRRRLLGQGTAPT